MTPWTTACQASLSFIISQNLLKLMSIESVMSSKHLIFCCLLLLPSIFSSIRVSSNESVHIRFVHQYWSSSFSTGPSNKYSGLISFRIDWFDPLAVQGTVKSLLQRHSSKASILRLSAFFIVQLSHPYMTTGKTIALTRWTFVDKVMFLPFNTLFRFVKSFLYLVTFVSSFYTGKALFLFLYTGKELFLLSEDLLLPWRNVPIIHCICMYHGHHLASPFI